MNWKGECDERGLKVVWGVQDFAVVGLMFLIVLIFTFIVMGPLFWTIGHIGGAK